jgi:hypothetical protein
LKKVKISILSIITGLICIATELKINYDIACMYFKTTGKNRALFGLIEISTFYYRYYALILVLLALFLTIYAWKQKEALFFVLLAALISLLSLASVFADIWKYMI